MNRKDKKTSKPKPKKKREKSKVKEPIVVEHPLDKFGSVRKTFILEHIRTINYRDIAKLIDINPDDIKVLVEKIGIKLPIKRTSSWVDIDVGQFISLSDCARCQIQINHRSFYVGINNCRKCYEKNIDYLIQKGENIVIKFSHEY